MNIRGMIFIIAAIMTASPIAHADGLTGTFSNQVLTITLKADQENHVGTASAQGRNFPVLLQLIADGVVQGYYTDQGQKFPIYGSLQEDNLYLLIDGNEVLLTRQQTSADTSAPARNTVETPEQTQTATPADSALTLRGEEVGDKYLGFKFTPPTDWRISQSAAGFAMDKNGERSIIVVLVHGYNSLAQLRAAAGGETQLGQGSVLRVTGDIRAYGQDGIAAVLGGSLQYLPAAGYAISRLSPHGGGATVIAVTTQVEDAEKCQQLAESIGKSLQFAKPVVPPVADQWKERLTASRLTYMWSYYSGGSADGSYVGGSQTTTIDLCPQGYFRYSDSNQMAVDGGGSAGYGASGYGHGNDRGNGTWKVVGRGRQANLVLNFHDGRIMEHQLALQDGKTYLDNRRYFRTYANDAVAEHRPQCW